MRANAFRPEGGAADWEYLLYCPGADGFLIVPRATRNRQWRADEEEE